MVWKLYKKQIGAKKGKVTDESLLTTGKHTEAVLQGEVGGKQGAKYAVGEEANKGNDAAAKGKRGFFGRALQKGGALASAVKKKVEAVGEKVAKHAEESRFLGKAKEHLSNLGQNIKKTAKKMGKNLNKVKNMAMKNFRKGPDFVDIAKQKARQLRIEHMIKDLTYLSHGIARGALYRASYKLKESVDDEVERRRRLREAEEERQRKEREYMEMVKRQCSLAAGGLWDKVYHHAMTEGVRLVMERRVFEAFLRAREKRVLGHLERLVRGILLRDKALAFASAIIKHHLVPNIYVTNERRMTASLKIQTCYRALVAKRDFLMRYLLVEAILLDEEKYEVWKRWKKRLNAAVTRIAHVETEEHKRIKRIIWARTEYAKAAHEANVAREKARKPVEPGAKTAMQKEYHGRMAMHLPSIGATKIIAPIAGGGDKVASSKLDWIGVPVGVATEGEKLRMVYQPVSTYMLGLDLSDARGRREAEERLGLLRHGAIVHEEELLQRYQERQARFTMEQHDFNVLPTLGLSSTTEGIRKFVQKPSYDEEQRRLWSDVSSFLL